MFAQTYTAINKFLKLLFQNLDTLEKDQLRTSSHMIVLLGCDDNLRKRFTLQFRDDEISYEMTLKC